MSANDKLFIENIRNNSELYDTSNIYFWNKARKKAIWEELELKFKENAKRKWKNLRSRYCREKQKIEQNKETKKIWNLYPLLQFLDDFLKKSYKDPLESNISSPAELLTTKKETIKIEICADDNSYIEQLNETSSSSSNPLDESEDFNSKIGELEVQSILEEIKLVNKCGEIFMENDKFVILCEFCLEKFNIFENYIHHVLIDHKLIKNGIIQPKIGIVEPKEEQLDLINTIKREPSQNSVTDLKSSPQYEDKISDLDELIPAPGHHLNMDQEVSEPIKSEVKNVYIHDKNVLDLCHRLKSYECLECNTIFNNNYTFYIHNKNLHPNLKPKLTKRPYFIKTENNTYVCSICHQYFQRIIDISDHHRKNHVYKNIRYKCNKCEKSYREKRQLKFHMNIHNNIRPYKCQSCKSSFTNPQYLKEHLEIHKGNKKHSCRFCEKKFISSSTKKYHEQTVHEKIKLYQCEDCGDTFPKNSILLNHKNIKHNPNYVRQKYECDICHIKLGSNNGLKRHKFLHEGKKPYKCDICFAKFNRQSSLVVHKKIHSDIKSYICDICGKKFAQSPGLYSHMKSHGTNMFSLKKNKSLIDDNLCKS